MADRIKPGEEKIKDILNMPFVPNLSQMLKPINDLLAGGKAMERTETQQKSFEETNKALTSTQALFDPKLPARLSADSFGYGLGAVLEQQQKSGEWKPVHFASRVLSDVETRYAHIKKEVLAATWACEKLGAHLIGLPKFELCTDHKPLVSILGEKSVSELSTRLQRFRMRPTPFRYQLTPFRYVINHIPGKCMHAADTLSRMPTGSNAGAPDVILEVRLEEAAIAEIPASPAMWTSIREAQERDPTCKLLRDTILKGWPEEPHQLPIELKPFHQDRGILNILNILS
ncbi:hypothetical protein FOCC_FOCC016229 [Frankliniella occidentalis]|nr:hypothetical protein FOCC_FOCC016229 [Frankliniella occidentalis]